jgi:anti-anti-sigma factor
MSKLARLSIESRGGFEIARIEGEVDLSNADDLGDRVLEATSNKSEGVILDLTQTSYLDSAGIRLILEVRSRLRRRRQRLRVVARPESFVADVLRTTAIDDSVPVDPTLAEALDAAGD